LFDHLVGNRKHAGRKPTRTGLTKVTRSMLGTEMQSAIYRDQGAQSGAADGR
jgi:hypothetical protein